MGDKVAWKRGPTKKPGFNTFIDTDGGNVPVHRALIVQRGAYFTELYTQPWGMGFIHAFLSSFDEKGNRLLSAIHCLFCFGST